jgi:peptidoglycan hydrolase-like protein with peptidoglycan-binding domain
MVAFRAIVSQLLDADVPARPLIPAVEAERGDGKAARRTLRRGDEGDAVKALQQLLQLAVDGKFGPNTEAAVRQFQRDQNMVPDGIVGPRTWAKLDEVQSGGG